MSPSVRPAPVATMARTMARRIRGRRCATRASFSGFACFGPLDELDAEGVEHLLQQSLFLRREIALGLGFEHRQDVDDFLCLGEIGSPPRRALADLLARSEERRVGKECRSRWVPA